MATAERGLRVSYDFALRNVNVEDPPLLIVCSTVADASRAPAGMHTIKIVGNQPYEAKEGPEHLGKIKNEGFHANLEHMRKIARNLTDDTILERVLDRPLVLER